MLVAPYSTYHEADLKWPHLRYGAMFIQIKSKIISEDSRDC